MRFRETLAGILTACDALGRHEVWAPVNISRLIAIARRRFACSTSGDTVPIPGLPATVVTPDVVVEAVEKLVSRLSVVPGVDALSCEAQGNATLLFTILVRTCLASKPVVLQHQLSLPALQWVVGEVERRFSRARCPAGV